VDEPKLWEVPFRGGTFKVWSDTDPGTLAVIAQIGLADPKLDAFYEAAGVTLKSPDGKVVFPPPRKNQPTRDPPISAAVETQPEGGGTPSEDGGVLDMFG
jgi:hypothetical protein